MRWKKNPFSFELTHYNSKTRKINRYRVYPFGVVLFLSLFVVPIYAVVSPDTWIGQFCAFGSMWNINSSCGDPFGIFVLVVICVLGYILNLLGFKLLEYESDENGT
jgi:hypothetical protein